MLNQASNTKLIAVKIYIVAEGEARVVRVTVTVFVVIIIKLAP